MLKGIDISSYQKGLDYNTILTQSATGGGIDFAILKTSEGAGITDNMLLTHNAGFINKVPVGYYHFARPDLGNTPEAEAQYFLNACLPEKGDFLCLDFEVKYADAVNWCKRWLDYVSEKMGGYKPVLYINLSTENSLDWSPVVNADYGLWVAVYDNSPETVPSLRNWTNLAFKQYTSSGRLNGYNGNLDVNTFFGDKETLIKYTIGGVDSSNPIPPVDGCEEKLANLQNKINEFITEIESIQSTNKQLTEDKDNLAREISNYQTSTADLNRKIELLFSDLQNKESILAVKSQEIDRLNSLPITSDTEGLKSQIEALQLEISNLKVERDELAAENKSIDTENDTLLEELDKKEEQVDNLRTEMMAVKASENSLSLKVAELEAVAKGDTRELKAVVSDFIKSLFSRKFLGMLIAIAVALYTDNLAVQIIAGAISTSYGLTNVWQKQVEASKQTVNYPLPKGSGLRISTPIA